MSARPPASAARSEAGFTLVEILVGMVLTLIMSLVGSSRSSSSPRGTLRAPPNVSMWIRAAARLWKTS